MSPVAAAIADAVAGHRTRTVPIAVVLTAAASVDHTAASMVGWRARVADAVAELAAAGIVAVPKTRFDRTAFPPLPAYVTRPARPPPDGQVGPVVWHAELSWAAEAADAGLLSAGEQRFLGHVNRWLPSRRGVVVPLRERSLDVFGDEKAVERRLLGPVFGPGRLSLEFLECEPVWPPVHQQVFGPGAWLLVENYTTYVSLARCAAESGFGGRVVWGAGTQVGTRLAALALAADTQAPPALWYFGDVDAGGFRVARTATRRVAELHFPPLEPARPLYALAVELGRQRPDPDSPGAADVAEWAARWVGGSVGDTVAAVVAARQRIVQETVGAEVLAGHALNALLA